MSHQSENSVPLKIENLNIHNIEEIKKLNSSIPAVWLYILSFNPTKSELEIDLFLEHLKCFLKNAHEKSVICFLTNAPTSAEILANIQNFLRYQLWISIKYNKPFLRKETLANHHGELLILTTYRKNLVHTKTRVAYTYCPTCNKTTKDYGGKKHTYHEYGTLLSDVWRDISIDPDSHPSSVIDRLKDLFGLTPYKTLYVAAIKQLFKPKKNIPAVNAFNTVLTGKIRKNLHDSLICGDSLDVLKTIPSDSVDFCFADPPYNLKKKYDNWNDGLDIQDYFEWCDRWLYELGRILKPGRTLAVLNIPLWTVRHYTFLKSILNFQDWIVWEGLSLPVRMIMPSNYSIVCFSKGKPEKLSIENKKLETLKEFYCVRQNCIKYRNSPQVIDREPITDLWWDIHRLKHNANRVDHPCQLPPLLMQRLISLFTNEGDSVLDPFNGVGTTTLSAQFINRSYIGIELSEYYHSIALERHKELSLGLDPFRKNEITPKSKNNYVPRLRKQKYLIPKKELQLDVKRISILLKDKLPTREDVQEYGKYPIELYDNYFLSWGEVCAAARTTGMTETKSFAKKRELQLELFK